MNVSKCKKIENYKNANRPSRKLFNFNRLSSNDKQNSLNIIHLFQFLLRDKAIFLFICNESIKKNSDLGIFDLIHPQYLQAEKEVNVKNYRD